MNEAMQLGSRAMTSSRPAVRVENSLATYWAEVGAAMGFWSSSHPSAPDQPAFALPALDTSVIKFATPSTVRAIRLGSAGRATLTVLDLRCNPATRTTKTIASLVIVARAIQHIRETGERILIVTPTSANKGTALRDAVFRAVSLGLATSDQLRICTAVPRDSFNKLWASDLVTDDALSARNKVLVFAGEQPDGVKECTSEFVARYRADVRDRLGLRCWYTLDLGNYIVADTIRAFFDAEHLSGIIDQDKPVLHVHAVSSAYGLLGYDLGWQLVQEQRSRSLRHPQFFIVQHLGTPDLVLSLYFDSFSRDHLPHYQYDRRTQVYCQREDPRFPSFTRSPDEVIDPTFYTHRPPTAEKLRDVVARHGGGGIVVSRDECIERYPQIREMLTGADIEMPSDPEALCEWALVMAMTGALNALDRGLISADAEIVIHGSGTYGRDDYEPYPQELATYVATPEEMKRAILAMPPS